MCSRWTTTAALALCLVAVLAIPARADGPPASTKAPDEAAAQEAAAKFAAVLGAYELEQAAHDKALIQARTEAEISTVRMTKQPPTSAVSRRMMEVAAMAPGSEAARDALVWVIEHPERSDLVSDGKEFDRAVEILARDHGDDPEAIRVGLRLHMVQTPIRERLLRGFVATAKGREAKGLARLALAIYLDSKAEMVPFVKKTSGGKMQHVWHGVVGEDGQRRSISVEQTDEEHAYWLQMRTGDVNALDDEAEGLAMEVARDCGNVPYVTRRMRELEAALKKPVPTLNGQTMSDKDIERAKKDTTLGLTLGSEAEKLLARVRASR